MKLRSGSTYSREATNGEASTSQPSESKTDGPKQFDCVADASDHKFCGQTAQATDKKTWTKSVQREWEILETNLPDTIYVRVYEERMDLMRALIVGPADTPYQDGLFVFDIWLPPHYPASPPVVHYHSGGERINPNLYDCGKVCLSLLNTWAGTGTENWSPSSTILQRSMGTPDGERRSREYSDNALVLTCKAMMYLICLRPLHVTDVVTAHFRARGPHILAACDAHLRSDMCRVAHAKLARLRERLATAFASLA
eukprot:jgi/Mesen1/1251/ME000129S00346